MTALIIILSIWGIAFSLGNFNKQKLLKRIAEATEKLARDRS